MYISLSAINMNHQWLSRVSDGYLLSLYRDARGLNMDLIHANHVLASLSYSLSLTVYYSICQPFHTKIAHRDLETGWSMTAGLHFTLSHNSGSCSICQATASQIHEDLSGVNLKVCMASDSRSCCSTVYYVPAETLRLAIWPGSNYKKCLWHRLIAEGCQQHPAR